MKQLIIFTLTLFLLGLLVETASADTVIGIHSDKFADLQITEKTLNKAMKQLKRVVRKAKYLKGDWTSVESESIFSRKGVNDELEYFHPTSFSVTIVDNTAELAEKKAKRKEWRAKRKLIRSLDLDKGDETVAEWRAKISKALKQLIKDNLKEVRE